MTTERDRAIVDSYLAGQKWENIAAEHNISPALVSVVLRKHDVTANRLRQEQKTRNLALASEDPIGSLLEVVHYLWEWIKEIKDEQGWNAELATSGRLIDELLTVVENQKAQLEG